MKVHSVTFRLLEKAGRLGNQLFQVAATVGIARALGAQPCLPSRWSYRPFLSCPVEWFRPPRGRSVEAWQAEPAAHLGKAALYLQDPALFRDVADEIRAAFQPNERAESHLGWRQEWDGAIALHVRRGDLLTQEQGFQPALTVDAPDYYRTALDAIDSMGVLPVVVFSDDPEWCAANTSNFRRRPDDSITVWHGEPRSHVPAEYRRQAPRDWIDLMLMSHFEHLVMSNSTFAWWAAWLNECPDVLYPSLWFGPKLDYIDTDLLFAVLPWRRVPC